VLVQDHTGEWKACSCYSVRFESSTRELCRSETVFDNGRSLVIPRDNMRPENPTKKSC
jgi:hypothetical protein